MPLINVNDYTIYEHPENIEIGSVQLVLDGVSDTLWRDLEDGSVRTPYAFKYFGSTRNWNAMFEYVVPLDYVSGDGFEISFDVEFAGDGSPAGLNTLECWAETLDGGPITPYTPGTYPNGSQVLLFQSSGTDIRQDLTIEGKVRVIRTFVIPGANRSESDPAGIAGFIANGSGGSSSLIPAGSGQFGPGDTISIRLAGYNSSQNFGAAVWTTLWGEGASGHIDVEVAMSGVGSLGLIQSFSNVPVAFAGSGTLSITVRTFECEPDSETTWEATTPTNDTWACATPDDDEWVCVDDAGDVGYGVLLDVNGNPLAYVDGGHIKLVE